MKQRLICFFYQLLTIYSVETFLFKNKDLNPREIRAKQLQKPYDKRDKINVIEDLRKGIDAY